MFDDEFDDDEFKEFEELDDVSYSSKEEIELYKNDFARSLKDLMEYYSEWLSFNEIKQRETLMTLRRQVAVFGDSIFLMNGTDLMEKFQDITDDEARKIVSMFVDADLPHMASYFCIMYRHKKNGEFMGLLDVDDDDDDDDESIY